MIQAMREVDLPRMPWAVSQSVVCVDVCVILLLVIMRITKQ